jgi:hypothetical protein
MVEPLGNEQLVNRWAREPELKLQASASRVGVPHDAVCKPDHANLPKSARLPAVSSSDSKRKFRMKRTGQSGKDVTKEPLNVASVTAAAVGDRLADTRCIPLRGQRIGPPGLEATAPPVVPSASLSSRTRSDRWSPGSTR